MWQSETSHLTSEHNILPQSLDKPPTVISLYYDFIFLKINWITWSFIHVPTLSDAHLYDRLQKSIRLQNNPYDYLHPLVCWASSKEAWLTNWDILIRSCKPWHSWLWTGKIFARVAFLTCFEQVSCYLQAF